MVAHLHGTSGKQLSEISGFIYYSPEVPCLSELHEYVDDTEVVTRG